MTPQTCRCIILHYLLFVVPPPPPPPPPPPWLSPLCTCYTLTIKTYPQSILSTLIPSQRNKIESDKHSSHIYLSRRALTVPETRTETISRTCAQPTTLRLRRHRRWSTAVVAVSPRRRAWSRLKLVRATRAGPWCPWTSTRWGVRTRPSAWATSSR